jgi:hypothetical protein
MIAVEHKELRIYGGIKVTVHLNVLAKVSRSAIVGLPASLFQDG